MLTVPITVLFSTILFRESLNTLQIIGLALIMGGSFAVSSSETTLKLQRPTKYEAYAVLTTIFLTGGTLYVNYAIDSASLASHLIVLSPIASIPGTLVAYTRRKSFKRLVTSKDYRLSALIGFTTALHIAAFWGAVSVIDNLSVISALSSFRIVTVFAASYVLLNERTSLLQKLAGSTLALAGLLLAR